MLVLSRKLNESIVINDSIVITVCDIDKDRVRIGIDAPKDIRVFRKELLDNAKIINEESTTTFGNLDELKNKLF